MPRAQVSVEPVQAGRWLVRVNGQQRAESLHDHRAAAVKRGRELAEQHQGDLIIQNSDGDIIGRENHGRHP